MPRSNWAREPQLLSLRVWSLCSATREAMTVKGPRTAMKSGPRLPQLEKALAQKWRPNTAVNKKNKTKQNKKKSLDLKKKKKEHFTYGIVYFHQEAHLGLVTTIDSLGVTECGILTFFLYLLEAILLLTKIVPKQRFNFPDNVGKWKAGWIHDFPLYLADFKIMICFSTVLQRWPMNFFLMGISLKYRIYSQ